MVTPYFVIDSLVLRFLWVKKGAKFMCFDWYFGHFPLSPFHFLYLHSPQSFVLSSITSILCPFSPLTLSFLNCPFYNKAINALKVHPTPITSFEEARSIVGIGNRLADKIAEILATGHLRQAECLPDSIATLTLFTGIWGVGHNTAQAWYRQGLRSLEDVRNQATLTRQQEIGLQLYHELQQRIPRAEVDCIEHTVQEAAVAVDPAIRVVACGSYRRGRDTCGDVDLLVTQVDEGGSIAHRALPLILARLRTEGEVSGLIRALRRGGGRSHKRLRLGLRPEGWEFPRLPWGLARSRSPSLLRRKCGCLDQRWEGRCARGRSVHQFERSWHFAKQQGSCVRHSWWERTFSVQAFSNWHPKPVSGCRRGLCRWSWTWTSGRGFESHRGGSSRCDRTRRGRYPGPALPTEDPLGPFSFWVCVSVCGPVLSK
uniref:DNA polymerase n=1 Tax=Eptatretus burgeri TaxID=7764 RepID=A0A8C4X203_EPTBU